MAETEQRGLQHTDIRIWVILPKTVPDKTLTSSYKIITFYMNSINNLKRRAN